VHYSEAQAALLAFVDHHGIPVAETQAGKGALPYDHPLALGAIGATGTPGANLAANQADLIIGIGTRYSDFTSASNTLFSPSARFINLNVAELDVHKHHALPLLADARAGLEELSHRLGTFRTPREFRDKMFGYARDWDTRVTEITAEGDGPLTQAQVIGVLNAFSGPRDVVVCAAGSLPGDLHKLWRTRDPRGYHMEYGYSCMGYEIAAGMGVKLADPTREVYVMVGDGSFLMLNSEIATMASEGLKVVILVLDNHGFASIGGLSKSLGSDGFGTKYRHRAASGQLDGESVAVDYAAICAGLGARVFKVDSAAELRESLQKAAEVQRQPVCIVMQVPRSHRVSVDDSSSWWDVPVAEVSQDPAVQAARSKYEEERSHRRR
jgi:3D-(3,5/4)-trihydroxycyclohexane-1,2-dione acylhydrolase (decyclizing)